MKTETETVLLFVENSTYGDLLNKFLQSSGYQVKITNKSEYAALDYAKFSLAIIDELTAQTHLTQIINIKHNIKPTVLPLLIALSKDSDGTIWLENGCDEIIQMPLNHKEFTAHLNILLELRGQTGEYYKKFLDEMHEAVFILDENYQIIDCNFMVKNWYGYEKAEIIGKNLSDIRAPEQRDIMTAQMKKVIEENGGMWETIHLRKDGTAFFVEVSCTPIVLGYSRRFYHVVRDVNDRKNNEAALRRSEDRYRQIVELSADTIFIHRDGKILFINQAGLKMFGASHREQLVGKSIWMLYPEDRHGIVRGRNKMMEETKQPAPLIEHTMIKLDGRFIHVEAIACLIDYENQQAFYVILRDITERKKTNMFLDMQYSVSKDLLESPNLVDAATNVLKTICTNLKLDVGKLLTFDQNGNALRCVAIWSNDKEHNKVEEAMNRDKLILVGEGLSGRVLSTVEPCWVEDVTKLFADAYPQDYEYKLGIATPILSGNEIIGVMEFMNKNPLIREDGILHALFSIGNQIGSFLKRKNFEKELSYATKHDAITGLANRLLFAETLAFEINMAKNKDKRLAVLFLDINAFRDINGAMGHMVGDQLLRLVAKRLTRLVGNDTNVARFGDDQFAIILNTVSRIDDVTEFVQQMNVVISEPFMIEDQKVNITLCIGVSFYPEDSEDVESLLKSASIALSRAKESGPGTLQFCTVDMTNLAKKRISMENDLREAVKKDEFILYYQPVVECPSMRIEGFEALLRWKRNGAIVSPAEFIPLAEKTQVIVPVGEWIIHTACAQSKLWQAVTDKPTFVSVNISPVQFKHSGVVDILTRALEQSGLDPNCLKIEVTEAAVMEDVQKSIKTLSKIKDMGIKISIDDFGTGYSSLSYLKQLPIDYLKIDQSFVRDMTRNPNDAAIVKTIIGLADNLGYRVIAEGVETEEQLEFITKLGCHEIQGYYFSRPLPVPEATEFLKQGKL